MYKPCKTVLIDDHSVHCECNWTSSYAILPRDAKKVVTLILLFFFHFFTCAHVKPFE